MGIRRIACPATEACCGDAVLANGSMPCQGAFFHLFWVHGWFAEGSMTDAQEGLIHTYESACMACGVGAPYDANIADCAPQVCTDPAPSQAACARMNGA